MQYPWYPLYGQDVIVHGARKSSQGVLVCQVDGEKRDNREIPTWMFDAVRCARMASVSPPQACWTALLDLRRLLDEAQPQEVPAPVEDRCPSTMEGTDGTPTEATPTHPARRPVRPATARRPRWPDLPPETRQTVTALLARVLGDPRVVSRPEVEHE